MKRVVFNIAIIASVIYLPWWFSALLVIAACLIVEKFYEVIAYGIIADSIYGARFSQVGFPFVATLYTLIIFTAAFFLRKRLAW